MERIGWVGTGIMGEAMAGHLLKTGYKMKVYNRTKAKADKLVAQGAEWCSCPREVADGSDVVVSIVGMPHDVQEVVLGAGGVAEGMAQGKVLVDMTTSTPSLAREIWGKASAEGWHSVDAPVSGGDIGARNATLTIFCGGDEPVIQGITPILSTMGTNITHAGPAGAGQHLKMSNQILVCSTILGVCESLLYASHAGLDLYQTIAAISKGAAGGYQIANLGPKTANRDFAPGFYIDHFVKDLGIALQEADHMKLDLPGLKLAKNLFVAMQELGHGQKGTQALILALEHLKAKDA